MMTRRIGLMMGMLVLFLVGVGVGVLAQGEARPEAAQGGEAVNGVGTAFTYQGVLTDNEEPANGTYDLEFRLYDAATGGNQIGTLVAVNDHAVTDGLLTVTLDFGEAVFTGSPRYLEIRVNGELLTDRQPLTASPYAIHSGTAHALAAEMQPPAVITATASTGGFLSAGTYYFKIVASDGVGTSVGSEEVSCTVNGSSTNRCALVWEAVPGAAVYRVYKGATSGGQNLYQTAVSNSYNYDTDSGATTGSVPTTATAFVNHINPSGDSWLLGGRLGIGTTDPTAKLDIAGDVLVQGNLEVLGTYLPSGIIWSYAGSTPPEGWFLCDGSEVSRIEYPELFEAVGTTWGSGDGTTTFNLPDLRGRLPIGSGQGVGLTNRVVGSYGGEETHTLSVAEMPAHTHNLTTVPSWDAGGGYSGGGWFGDPTQLTTSSAGGNAPHDIMNPFAVITCIIKN